MLTMRYHFVNIQVKYAKVELIFQVTKNEMKTKSKEVVKAKNVKHFHLLKNIIRND